MPRYDATRVQCFVFTFKAGVLSAVAHDLKLRVTHLSVEVAAEGTAVAAQFDPSSLRVEAVMKHGHPASGVLSAGDMAKIEATIRDEVLQARRFPSIAFASTSVRPQGPDLQIEGNLTLCGCTRALGVTALRRGASYVATADLHQPDYGIEPYRAMMGTLKIQPGVRVEIHVPAG